MGRGSTTEVRVFLYFLGELLSRPVDIRDFSDLHRRKSFLLIKLVQSCISIVSLIMRFQYIGIWLVGPVFVLLEKNVKPRASGPSVLWYGRVLGMGKPSLA
jgi:hypothetical protein